MSEVLVAYYSWSGNTAKVAKAIAEALGADLEEIRDLKPREGFFAYIRWAMEAARERPAPIMASTRNVADYDVVLLGCPVWAQQMASPLRAFILREKQNFKQIGLFCTLGGAGGDAALSKIAALCDKQPIVTLQTDARAPQSGAWRGSVANFVVKMRAH